MVEGIDALGRHHHSTALGPVLANVLHRLRSGSGFADAMSANSAVFAALLVASVRSAGETSDPPVALARYAGFAGQKGSVKDRIVSAAIYPLDIAAIAAVGAAVLGFLALYVIPRFVSVYESMQRELPLSAQVLLFWGRLVREHGLLLLFIGVGSIAAVAIVFRVASVQARFAQNIARAGILGQLIQQFHLARLYRTLPMRLAGGIPLVTAMAMADTFAIQELKCSYK